MSVRSRSLYSVSKTLISNDSFFGLFPVFKFLMVKRATGFGSMEDLLFLASNLAQLHKILFRPFESYTIGI